MEPCQVRIKSHLVGSSTRVHIIMIVLFVGARYVFHVSLVEWIYYVHVLPLTAIRPQTHWHPFPLIGIINAISHFIVPSIWPAGGSLFQPRQTSMSSIIQKIWVALVSLDDFRNESQSQAMNSIILDAPKWVFLGVSFHNIMIHVHVRAILTKSNHSTQSEIYF